MDNSAYVPSTGHLSSPALVVFSQAAGGLQDALRIQRPFNPQFAMSESSKDIHHRPFSGTTFGLRHMEAYSSIPAHILNHLQPQFLHPGLSLGSGAFRPLADLKTSFPTPSAFAPPPKCLKIETNSDNIHQNHTNHGIFSPNDERILGPSPVARTTDSCSPANSASMSPQPQTAVKEESLDASQMSEDGEPHGPATDNDSPGIHEENRGFRIGPLFGGGFSTSGAYTFSVPGLPPAAHALAKTTFLFDHDIVLNKKKRDPSSCPICGLTISPGDLETHFMHELERLYKLSGTGIAATRKRRAEPGRPPALPGDSGPEGRWETFQRIKTNRQGRLRLKIRKRKSDDGCPICTGRTHRTQEELNMHVEQCSRKNSINDEDETVDVEGDSELDEWPERRRNTLVVGGTTIASSTNRPTADTDNEGDDVIVDGDEPEDSNTFGPSQYTESDVLKENKDKDNTVQSQVATVNSSGDVEVKVESAGGQQCDSNVSTSDAEPSSRAQMIEELRNRIRQLEAEGGGDTSTTTTEPEDYKCLICLEHYKKPVISTVCWHVHCEECWLHTLGSKKVCPQCSMITSPTDLRRIFM